MSYRELRNFTEIMRALGYPRLISMENFRTPNFELVADVLYWMVKLYDPDTTISDRVEFENERVEFLTGIASLLAAKARLKLNTKKLYASDGRAVQELLKLASLLHRATRSCRQTLTTRQAADDETPPPQIKMQDVKDARKLASELTQSGARLYDLLETELTEKQERGKALRFLDVASAATEGSKDQQAVERRIRDLIEQTRQAVEDGRKEVEELDADQRTLAAKITKRSEELERTEKRLKSLENVRPQFLEEAEKLEKELQRYYEVYVERQRNLSYLEGELDRFRVAEEEAARDTEARLKKMREKLLKEEVELMRGGAEGRALAENSHSNASNGGIFGKNNSSSNHNNNTNTSGRVAGGIAARPNNSGNKRGGARGRSDDEEEDDDDEELSVNERYNAQNRHMGHSSQQATQNARGKSGGSSSAGRGAIAADNDFLDDDEEDEDEDEEEDDDDDDDDEEDDDRRGRGRGGRNDGNLSESDDF